MTAGSLPLRFYVDLTTWMSLDQKVHVVRVERAAYILAGMFQLAE